jgi:hypothetical protein
MGFLQLVFTIDTIVFKNCMMEEVCFTKPFFGSVKLCIAGKELVEIIPD